MSWIVAIALALAAFAAIALLFRLPRASWMVVLAALGFGLAGYAIQASPNLAGAPKQGFRAASEEGRQFVDFRKEVVGEDWRSRSPYMLMADEWVRRGRYQGAVTILNGIVRANPRDGDAWLALGNALLLHADGQVTPATLHAWRMAEQALPGSAAPIVFQGAGMLREGRLIETHRLWSERLAAMPEDAPGRAMLAGRLAALEQLLRQIVAESGQATGPEQMAEPGETGETGE